MKKNMIFGLSLALVMGTTGLAQAATSTTNIPGVTVERDGGVSPHTNQARHWQDGHRQGQRGPHQRGQQGENGHRQHGAASGLLTQAEAQSFRDQLVASKDYNACKRIQNQQHQTLLKRAKDKGVTIPTEPRKAGMCERMSDRGYFNRTAK